MKVRMNGHFERLATLSTGLSFLAESGRREIANRAAAAIAARIEKQYGTGRGPYGEMWAPKAGQSAAPGRKPRAAGRSFLQKTGAMKRATDVIAGVKGVTVTAPKPAGFHQSGTRKMPARRLVPSGTSLSTPWREAVTEAALEVLAEVRVR